MRAAKMFLADLAAGLQLPFVRVRALVTKLIQRADAKSSFVSEKSPSNFAMKKGKNNRQSRVMLNA
jgi:hypothetical protein